MLILYITVVTDKNIFDIEFHQKSLQNNTAIFCYSMDSVSNIANFWLNLKVKPINQILFSFLLSFFYFVIGFIYVYVYFIDLKYIQIIDFLLWYGDAQISRNNNVIVYMYNYLMQIIKESEIKIIKRSRKNWEQKKNIIEKKLSLQESGQKHAIKKEVWQVFKKYIEPLDLHLSLAWSILPYP